MNKWMVCWAKPPIPAVSRVNDLLTFQSHLNTRCSQYGLPYTLVLAQAYQESNWKSQSFRYEPNYDRRYISSGIKRDDQLLSPRDHWAKNPAWLTHGPTVEDWFTSNPRRAKYERSEGRNYRFTAQTRLSSSYGIMQVMYATAIKEGFEGVPEELWDPFGIQWGVKHLLRHKNWMQDRGHPEIEALKGALARYNGGPRGNFDPANLRNLSYVEDVNRRHVQLFGEPFFEGL